MAVFMFKKIFNHNTLVITILVILIRSTQGVNLGLFAGDTKPNCAPVIIKKYSHKSPVVINVHSNPLISPLSRPKLPAKPPPLKLSDPVRSLSPLRKPFSPFSGGLPLIPGLPFVPISLKRPPYLPTLPIIPKVPFLPAITTVPSLLLKRTLPFQPSLPISIITPVHPLPYTPIPFKPIFSSAPTMSLKPLKIPILGKRSPLQKVLDAGIRTVTLPYTMAKRQENILGKVSILNKIGSLTNAELSNIKKCLPL